MKVLIVVLCYPFCVCSDVSSFISGTDHLYLFLSYQIGLTRGLLVSSVWKIWPLLSCFLFFLFFILQFYWSIINLQCCLHFSDVQQGYLHTHTHTHTHTHILFFFRFFSFLGYSVQFSRSVVSDSLRPHELQHTRPPCPSPTAGVYPNPCPLSWWCHPTIPSSVPFSSCPQSFPA